MGYHTVNDTNEATYLHIKLKPNYLISETQWSLLIEIYEFSICLWSSLLVVFSLSTSWCVYGLCIINRFDRDSENSCSLPISGGEPQVKSNMACLSPDRRFPRDRVSPGPDHRPQGDDVASPHHFSTPGECTYLTGHMI